MIGRAAGEVIGRTVGGRMGVPYSGAVGGGVSGALSGGISGAFLKEKGEGLFSGALNGAANGLLIGVLSGAASGLAGETNDGAICRDAAIVAAALTLGLGTVAQLQEVSIEVRFLSHNLNFLYRTCHRNH